MQTGQTIMESTYGAKKWGQIVCDCILNMILQKFDSETVYPVKNPIKCHGWRDGLVNEALAAPASGVGFRARH